MSVLVVDGLYSFTWYGSAGAGQINAKASRVLLGDPAFDMGLAELMLLMVEERSEGVHGRRHNDESSVVVLRFVAEKSSPSSPVA
ncbi:hypothetical protein [Xanthomonas campestris]|nr:hypothetical protein [Xanthomonas campestris]WHO91439.1 hypothetical protein QMY62_14115 [Xanthomonas campestris]